MGDRRCDSGLDGEVGQFIYQFSKSSLESIIYCPLLGASRDVGGESEHPPACTVAHLDYHAVGESTSSAPPVVNESQEVDGSCRL